MNQQQRGSTMSYIDTHKLIAALRNSPTTLTPAELQDVLHNIGAPSDQYNGWTNRETWAVHLWLTNNPVHYSECIRATAESIRVYAQYYCEEQISMWRVDWDAIARALTEE